MELRLLGPLEVWAGTQQVDAGPRRQRAVLAALAVEAGRPVPTEVLVGRVWGPEPPERAGRTLHTYITRIRRLLEAGGGAAVGPGGLVRRSGGYLLDVDPDQVDLHRFRRLVRQSRGPAGDGGSARLGLLREAIRLRRGELLAGQTGDWVDRLRQSWHQEYAVAAVAWADAELQAGDPASVVGPIGELAAEQPLAESLVVVLMRALAAVGRTADALSCYVAVQRRLADELGADPGSQLQAAHQAVLRGDLRTAATPAPRWAPAPAASRPVPEQLPADVSAFTGREAELAALDTLLPRAGAGEGGEPSAVLISAVSGTAGVGKTALAIRWAHRVKARFPDGQLYLNLRGYDPDQPMTAADALAQVLTALGVPGREIPADLDERAARYRTEAAAGGCWSCWTTPRRSSRSARCCRAPRRPPRW